MNPFVVFAGFILGTILVVGAHRIAVILWEALRDVVIDTIDAPVSLALYRARCDEVARLQARVRLLEAQLASVEQEG